VAKEARSPPGRELVLPGRGGGRNLPRVCVLEVFGRKMTFRPGVPEEAEKVTGKVNCRWGIMGNILSGRGTKGSSVRESFGSGIRRKTDDLGVPGSCKRRRKKKTVVGTEG